jgi:FdrA protein
MTVAGQIKKGAYFDSVTLMRVGKELAGLPGVADAAVVMGTRSNQAILHTSGLLTPKFKGAGDTDLLIRGGGAARQSHPQTRDRHGSPAGEPGRRAARPAGSKPGTDFGGGPLRW